MQYSKENYIGLGHVPIGIGALLKGWDISVGDFRDANRLHVVDFRAMTNACPHDCFHCFTNKSKRTLSLVEIKKVIDQIAEMKARSIDFLGEGEPTIDQDFFEIIEHTAKKGLQSVIFTDAATKMRDRDFVRRVKEIGASVCPKCDSLFNPEYQNWVVRDKIGTFFDQRNEAIQILIDEGFNEVMPDGTTRLGFDMVISKRNMDEVEKTLRYCRQNNLWIVFSFYLPSGRSGREDFDKTLALTVDERQHLRSAVAQIDKEFGFEHPIFSNFATMPCVELMQIYGDGRVSPCPGNEDVVGNIRTHTLKEMYDIVLNKVPLHCPTTFDGHCLCRPRV